ncbi:4-alpha-glucanotransferase, partial [Halomonas sp. BBD48]|nr:4-alpha-glucanotransferase [Halomonas sp. BBD48]
MSDDRLRELADAAGILVEWENSDSERCVLSSETQRTLLAVLGLAADDDAAIEASLAQLEQWRHPDEPAQWPPLITADCGSPIALPGLVPQGTPFTLILEDGVEQRGEVDANGRLPPIGAMGYHRLQIAGTQLSVAAAPKQCYGPADASGQPAPRLWGMAAQLYALRRPGDGGIGDTLALEHFARRAAEQGAASLAISPTHAMF